jgi:aspartyl/glutamyl-tRNA(Asn/Gln) amidotransferase C subunit
MSNQLSQIMEMMDQLKSVNTDDVEPLRSVVCQDFVWREDKVTEQDLRENLFKNVQQNFAKDIKCFIVPKMVE